MSKRPKRAPVGTYATHRMDGWVTNYEWREFRGQLTSQESVWLARFNDYWAGQLSKARMAEMARDDEDRKQRYRGNNGRKSDALRDPDKLDSLDQVAKLSVCGVETVEVCHAKYKLVWGESDDAFFDAARSLSGGKQWKRQRGG